MIVDGKVVGIKEYGLAHAHVVVSVRLSELGSGVRELRAMWDVDHQIRLRRMGSAKYGPPALTEEQYLMVERRLGEGEPLTRIAAELKIEVKRLRQHLKRAGRRSSRAQRVLTRQQEVVWGLRELRAAEIAERLGLKVQHVYSVMHSCRSVLRSHGLLADD